MPFEKVIPIQRQDGNKYLLRISEFKIDLNVDISIVDIQFVMVERDYKKPVLSELLYIGRELINYLKDNDVVLYYYCDTIDAQRSVRNSNRSPQEFRYILFDKIFERYEDLSLIKDDVIISENGGHFISLISNAKNKSILTEISNEVEKMNDK